MKKNFTKMSKSSGNIIRPEEIVLMISELSPLYEFRDINNRVIKDFKKLEIWRDTPQTGNFYTSSRLGKQPIFLHEINNPVPCIITHNDEEILQHANQIVFWEKMISLYE